MEVKYGDGFDKKSESSPYSKRRLVNTIMDEFNIYPFKYPNLPIQIVLFFSKVESKNGTHVKKTITDFIDYYRKKFDINEMLQPRHIVIICDKLVELGSLSVLQRGGIDGLNSSYICFLKNKELRSSSELQDITNIKLSCMIYDFGYIYEIYKQYINPILHISIKDTKEKQSLGTCFSFLGGLATAKHCLEDASKIAIKGLKKEDFNDAKVYIHPNEKMDIAFIQFPTQLANSILSHEKGNILDDVITMGFPKIAGFHNFITTETAQISARFTTTKGQVASQAKDIWIKEDLLLITAKIKGGNSGGPVINKNGSVIGISSQIAHSDGDYDDLGYGTVIPISFLVNDILSIEEDKRILFDLNHIEFIDFI